MGHSIIFIEGPVAFKAGRELEVRPDYVRMMNAIAECLRCTTVSARYYHADAPGSRSGGIDRFLTGLGRMPNVEVVRVQTRLMQVGCPSCGNYFAYHDLTLHTTMINDMLVGADEDRFDVGVVVSGRDDFIPASRILGSLEDMRVYVAFWGSSGMLSSKLRRKVPFIDLDEMDVSYRPHRTTTW